MGQILQNFHDGIDQHAKQEALENVKNLFSYFKKEDRLNFRADNLLRTCRKAKLFKMMQANRSMNIDLKSGISKLSQILADKKSKFLAVRAIEHVFSRH